MGNLVISEPEAVVSSAPSTLVVEPDGSVRLTDPMAAALITIQLEALADAVKTDAAGQLRDAVLRNQPMLNRVQFYPFVVRALGEGATDEAIVERLAGANIDARTATAWITEARAA
ncbi:hypothetical protein ACQEVX_19745 [Streptomyces syringium]